MTVSNATNRITFAGDDATTSFDTTPIKFFESSDLRVFVTTDATGETEQLTEGTHYTVSGGDESVGAVGAVNLAGGSAPHGALASGTTLVVLREVPLLQGVDFVRNDASDAEVAEAALDRIVMALQRLDDRLDRSLVVSDGDISGADFTVPTPSASKLVGWASDGLSLVNYSLTDLNITAVPAYALDIITAADDDAFFATMVDGMTAESSVDVADVVPFVDVSLSPDDGRKATVQQLLNAINALTEDLTPVKANDFVLSYDANESAAKKVQIEELPVPRSYLAGFGLANNGSDATNDIDVAVGECRDSTNAVNIRLSSALTKRLDATFTAGNNGGMLDTGAIADGTYHVFAIRKDSDGTGDVLASASPTAPMMPSGYTYFRRIGSILRESAALVAFSQRGDEFLRTPITQWSDSNPGTSAVTKTLSVPTDIKVGAIVALSVYDASTDFTTYGLLTSPDQADTVPSDTVHDLRVPFVTGGLESAANVTKVVRTNTSGQVRYRIGNSDAGIVTRGTLFGWLDTRGRGE